MTDKFRLTLAQLNPTVGAIAANAAKARAAWEEGRKAGADMVALTEMFITGYQTRDLIMKPAFWREAMATLEQLAIDCADGPALGIGGPLVGRGAALQCLLGDGGRQGGGARAETPSAQ